MSSSVATYMVLTTAAFSVTYLSYMMYAAYGLGALKAAAPFVGSVSLVFGIAHCLDRAQDAEDERAKSASSGGASKPKSGAAAAATTTPTTKAPMVPKRRRVAD
eukprot:g10491.t1